VIGVYVRDFGGLWFGAACNEQRVFGTSFSTTEQEALWSLLSGMPFEVPFETFSKPSTFAEKVLAAVKQVYDGKDVSPSFTLATEHLPSYTRAILQVTLLIPVGFVASYGSVARAAGGGPRAVGNVMARNPFAPIVPCHRVVRSDFTLGGYGGGLDVKLEFLIREKRGYKTPQDVPVGERNLRIFPAEFVLKAAGKV